MAMWAGSRLVFAAALAFSPGTAHALAADAPAPPASASVISLADYHSKLQEFDKLVANCQRQMLPANCDSDAVGPDVMVALPAGSRQIRLSWLREVLTQGAKFEAVKAQAEAQAKAQEEKARATAKAQAAKAQAQPASNKKAPSNSDDSDEDDDADTPGEVITIQPEFPGTTVAQRLAYARKRLAQDMHWAETAGADAAKPAAKPTADVAAERRALSQILSAREYKTTVTGPSLKDRLLERVARWINQVIGKLVQTGAKSKWIGTAAEIGFAILISVALVWFLIRLEKQGRFGTSLLRPGAGPGAASARDWQLWLEDARYAAGEGDWRGAIHLLYWASISRLEGSGMWPADRARTPREYLALLSPDSQHRPDLNALTRSFERTWYAGRPAGEADFRQAEQLASRLGAR